MRAAIFSSLAALVPDSRALIYLPARARWVWRPGAGAAWWSGSKTIETPFALRENIQNLHVPAEAGRVRAGEVFGLLARACSGAPFDLVFSDPPYEEAIAGDWQGKLAQALAGNGWVAPGGIWVYETEGARPAPEFSGWVLLRDKTYGATRVFIRQFRPE